MARVLLRSTSAPVARLFVAVGLLRFVELEPFAAAGAFSFRSQVESFSAPFDRVVKVFSLGISSRQRADVLAAFIIRGSAGLNR